MAKSRRRTRRSPPREERKEHRRSATFWLATLSTVVGIATGMFTLRDQVFPRESGSAQAVSTPAYQQQVSRVCDELNTDDSRRAREAKSIRRQLRRARTTTVQRNVLLDGQRRTIARSSHALASFTSLESPKPMRRTGSATRAAWSRNLTRLQTYAERLDRVGTRAELVAAIGYLSSLRTPLAQDGVKLMAGLRRLGGAHCDLRTPISTPTFPLPPLHRSAEKEVAGTGTATAAANGAARAHFGAAGSSDAQNGSTGGTSGGTGAGTGTPGTIGGAPPQHGAGSAGTSGGSDAPSGGTTGTPGTTGGGGVPEGGG